VSESINERHYKQRLRDLAQYANHKPACNFVVNGTSPCTCGFTALSMIVWAEVGTIEKPYPQDGA
jgi:glycerol dehydrogenase-like iron-containing ADH family enzyme